MNLKEIEQRVADLDISPTSDFVYELLRAYGFPKATISRLRNGTYNKASGDGELLWKRKVYYRLVNGGAGDLHALIETGRVGDPRAATAVPDLGMRTASCRRYGDE